MERKNMAAKETVDVPSVVTHKRNRKRMKDVVRKLREQVEFYFGDMNLRTGFLRTKIDQTEDGFVPIKLIASFNKVKALTSDVSVLTSALRTSDMLEVSTDGQKVRRLTPLAEPLDVDDRTVYVEDLPPGTTIDTMQRDFGKCGSVEYIKLPRHWDSKDLKGFAYVTFSNSEEALEALKSRIARPLPASIFALPTNEVSKKKRREEAAFDNFESGLEPQFPPRAPSSIAQSSSTPSAVQVGGEGEGRGGVTVAGSKGQSSIVGRKRQLDDGGESENNSDEKPSDTNDDSKLPVGDGPPQAKVKKIEEEGDEKGGKKKKRKKRKKKNKESVFPYKVLHKLEWNRLKQVYQQLQKQEMSRAKKLLAEYRESTPRPPHAAKGGDEHKELCTKTKRGADKIIRRLEETEFLKQRS